MIGKWDLVDVKWDSGEAFFEDRCRKELNAFNSNTKAIAGIKYGQDNQCHNTSIV
ncbi:hypothetical protein [Myroides sp. LoEW2-1]|uniref:hypothetical protein n=1 Tax=Myroides sp. LoEW2-1 TaxID=2683192 RepID=UPI00132AC93C|nr:hypothetical protein [Myroides sp. LoEW2-1]MVX36090.1 hypothetical protein [Myroides sp. LoEW2-1]